MKITKITEMFFDSIVYQFVKTKKYFDKNNVLIVK